VDVVYFCRETILADEAEADVVGVNHEIGQAGIIGDRVNGVRGFHHFFDLFPCEHRGPTTLL